jgi:hydroxymethylpyrimidine/phosphomethylpyrimidine kinase
MSSAPPLVLAFAASDPTGGAGLQADILTIAAMGCHPLSVLTALTVQDTSGVEKLLAIESGWVADQARRLLDDMAIDAFKLGVLGSVENISAIAEVASEHPEVPLILDPVLASGRGDVLATDEMVRALRMLIVPRSTLVTPNCLEASRLGGAQELIDLGCDYVLVTGTHGAGADVVNTLYGKTGVIREDRWQRLPGSYHGSGCTLASAIAAAIANGLEVPEAVRGAQEYTWNALRGGFRPGVGQFIPDRFFQAREAESHE